MKKVLVLAAALVLMTFALVQAAGFPEKDLNGFIMWGAGGATDNVARAVTPLVEKHLGKQIILVNKTGGTGAIATQYVSTQPSDGYTLLYGAENPQLYRVLKLSELDYKDFYPVNILARGVAVIVTNNNSPWKTMKDLVDDAAKRPGQINMGSTGPGGLPHVIGSLLKTVTKFNVNAVPFDGEGPGMTALQGGHVDFMPVGLTAGREHIRANRVKVLAIVSEAPIPGLENYPLVTKDIPDFKKYLPWGPFYGIWVKRDVPDAAKKKLVEAFKKGAAEQKFVDFIKDFGAVMMNMSGDEADKFLKRWQSVTAWALQDAGAAKVSPADLGIPKP
ncbi:MAG: tripartite tricarboxylate transporter substrate binding protein [Thermodesulfobacteriota bacterium]